MCLARQLFVVRYHNESTVQTFNEFMKELVQLIGIRAIKIPARLICQNKFWIVYQCARYSYPLLLPTRQGLRLVRQAVGET